MRAPSERANITGKQTIKRYTQINQYMTAVCEQGKVFLHSVNLKDRFAGPLIKQLLEWRRACSPDYLARLDPGLKEAHHSMRDLDIDTLRFKAFEYPGIPTPGAGTAIWMGSMIRAGKSLYSDAINPRPLSKHEIKYALRKSDIELIFEEARRRIAPNAVSRLNCLYVTDDIEVIKAIWENPIIKVRISNGSLVSRVDMSWFDDFCDHRELNVAQCDDFVNNYWKGNPHNSDCKWEYLVDGMIEVIDGLDDLRDALNERDGLM
ncbi:hypothetical protein ASZ90_012817 [hydrocarbon metagenome]|uniref:Uncharacterized protein n=1 Tax=hydrocarbon metagenome TaxID=938273 RepID=A0A0W8F9I6_9ZZZZ